LAFLLRDRIWIITQQPADLFLPLVTLPCHNPLRKINKQSAAGPAVAVMFCPSGMGEVTFPVKGNESASIIESDGHKIKENKLHSHKNRSASPS
jgi:hypothetical protein